MTNTDTRFSMTQEEFESLHETLQGYSSPPEHEQYVLVSDEHYDSTRWMEVRQMVFKDATDPDNPLYYRYFYRLGLTEMQENSVPDRNDVKQVFPHTTTVIEYLTATETRR